MKTVYGPQDGVKRQGARRRYSITGHYTAGTALADLESERELLGGLVLHPELIPAAVADAVTPATFAAPSHGAIFASMARLGPIPIFARPVGSLVDELARVGDLRLAGGPAEVVGLLLVALKPEVLPGAWERLRMLAGARQVRRVLREALASIERDPARARELLSGVTGAP